MGDLLVEQLQCHCFRMFDMHVVWILIGIVIVPIPLTELSVNIDRDQFGMQRSEMSETWITVVSRWIRPELQLITELNWVGDGNRAEISWCRLL